MRNAGRVLTRSMLLEHVWQYDFGGNDNVLDVYISYLRRKIDRGYTPALIHTVRGVGYMASGHEVLRSLRSLSSMRARMTAGFVFILAPCLLIASTLVPILAGHINELRSRAQVGWIVERASERMDRPDWRAQLDDLMAAKVPEIDHVALLILDRDGTVMWRSHGPGPAWPPATGSNWRREIRRLTPPPVEKPNGKGPDASGPVELEPPGLEKALDEWRKGLKKTLQSWRPSTGKAKALSPAQAKMALAAVHAKMADQGAVWPGKPWDDWRLVDGFVVGPKSRPRILLIFQSWWAVVHEQAALKLGLLFLACSRSRRSRAELGCWWAGPSRRFTGWRSRPARPPLRTCRSASSRPPGMLRWSTWSIP